MQWPRRGICPYRFVSSLLASSVRRRVYACMCVCVYLGRAHDMCSATCEARWYVSATFVRAGACVCVCVFVFVCKCMRSCAYVRARAAVWREVLQGDDFKRACLHVHLGEHRELLCKSVTGGGREAQHVRTAAGSWKQQSAPRGFSAVRPLQC